MARRSVPALFVVLAAVADLFGAHGLALSALLFAVPAASWVALVSVGALVDGRASRGEVALDAAVVALVVTGAAARSPVVVEGAVPALARTTLVVCLAVFCAHALLALVAELRGRAAADAA